MLLYNLNDHSDAWANIAYRMLVLCYGIYRSKREGRGFIVDWSNDILYHTSSNLNLFNMLFQFKNLFDYENRIQDCERIGIAKALNEIDKYKGEIENIIEEHININRACKLKAKKFCEIYPPEKMIGGCIRISSQKSILDNVNYGTPLVAMSKQMQGKKVFLVSDMPIEFGKEVVKYISPKRDEMIWSAYHHLTEYIILSKCKEKYFYRSEYIKPIVSALEGLI